MIAKLRSRSGLGSTRQYCLRIFPGVFCAFDFFGITVLREHEFHAIAPTVSNQPIAKKNELNRMVWRMVQRVGQTPLIGIAVAASILILTARRYRRRGRLCILQAPSSTESTPPTRSRMGHVNFSKALTLALSTT